MGVSRLTAGSAGVSAGAGLSAAEDGPESAEELQAVRTRSRAVSYTHLIRALGLKTDQEILDTFGDDPRIAATLEKDPCKNYEDAMLEIYRKLRPGEPPTVEAAETLMNNLFFDPRRYDLSTVGRYKFNKKLSRWQRVTGYKLVYPVADPSTCLLYTSRCV